MSLGLGCSFQRRRLRRLRITRRGESCVGLDGRSIDPLSNLGHFRTITVFSPCTSEAPLVGKSLGHYEILEPLGSGGMGDVYRAHDASLNRDVAIKVLLEDLADDPDRLARLKREAHLLAALNHPNVATIHGFEESE